MAQEEVSGQTTEDLDKPASNDAALSRKWRSEILISQKAQAKWEERGKKVERVYADERDGNSNRRRRFNILWSNVETLRPAVYMRTPKAQAVRRYRDRDPVARFASMLLERCVQTNCELYAFDAQIDQAVRDRLLPGRGQAWVFFDPTIEGEGDQADVTYYDVRAEYVPWQDFLHSVCRTWTENRWVGRRFYKTREELKTWLAEIRSSVRPEQVQLDYSVDGAKKDDGLQDQRSKAIIWEVWDKVSKERLFVAPGSGDNAVLGHGPAPMKFLGFFPCPPPLLATTTAKSLIPVPDYAMYQDQAEELNRVTERIGVLQKALKVVGLYDGNSTEVASMLTAPDNQMVPVKNWAMLSESGGAKGRIEWFPVEQVAEVLKGLYEIREQAKQTLYEVSGIGDILRGATDPDETATAQGIKAKWGSLRVRRVQKDVERFAADIMRLKAEVIAEHFPFAEIMRIAGVDDELLEKYAPRAEPIEPPQLPPDAPPELQQQIQQAIAQQQQAAQEAETQKFLMEVEQLLRDDVGRVFRIDVESDSTLEPDLEEEKASRIEFTTAISTFMKEAAPLATTGGESTAKLIGDVMLFMVRGFKKAEQLEQTIEQWTEDMQKLAAQPKPDPAEKELEMKAKEGQQKIAMEEKKTEVKVQGEIAKTEAQIAGQQMKTQADIAISQQNADVQNNIAVTNAAAQQAMMEGSPPGMQQ